MPTVIDRPPVGCVPAAGRDPERRPLLTLRLSDGHSWAAAFGASTADELRDGCFEAWVACRLEWQRRADRLPTHQTNNRAQVLAGMPRSLQLQVLDTCNKLPNIWISANHAADPMRYLVVAHPGSATNAEAWDAAPWADTWARCLRAWWAAAEMARFLGGLRAFFADDVLAAMRRDIPPAAEV